MSDNQVLIQIRGDVADINAKLADLKGHIGGVISENQRLGKESKSSWAMMAAGIASVIYTAQQVIDKLGYFITAYTEAESATMKLAVAMRNQGDYTKEGLADLEDYASQLQKTTSFEDDHLKALMGNLKTYGMTNEEVKQATKTILDFATAKRDEGMSVESAGELIGKAYQGQTERLKRYGIVIDDSIPKNERFGAVLKNLNDRFGGAAAADLETYAGRWKQIKNEFQDIAEVIGHVLLKAIEAVKFSISMLHFGFWKVIESLASALAWIMEKVAEVGAFVGIEKGASSAKAFAGHLRAVGKAFTLIKEEAWKTADANYRAMISLDNVDKAVSKMKPGSPTKPVIKDEELTKARDAWAKTMRDLEADINKIDLSPLDQKLIDIAKKAADLRASIPGKLPVGEKKAAKETIGRWESAETQKAIKDEQKKIAEEDFRTRSDLNKRIIDLNQQLTEANASETQKRIIQTEVEAEKQRITAVESYDAGVIDYQAYADKIVQIESAKTKAIDKINAEAQNAIRESDINERLYALDLAEKEGRFHHDTLKERIQLLEELKNSQEDYLKTLDKSKDPASWYAQADAIKKTQGELLGVKKELKPVFASLHQYSEEAANVWKNIGDAATNTMKGMEDALVDFVKTGKLSFKNLADSIIEDLIRITIQKTITGPLAAYMSSMFLTSSQGNIFQGGRVLAFAGGGIVTRPTFFPMANGTGLMGEAGPEAIMPLKRIGNKLGVVAESGSNLMVNVSVSADVGTKKLISDLQSGIENTVIKIIKDHS
jgi:lambda family phage tail tape measure protein